MKVNTSLEGIYSHRVLIMLIYQSVLLLSRQLFQLPLSLQCFGSGPVDFCIHQFKRVKILHVLRRPRRFTFVLL